MLLELPPPRNQKLSRKTKVRRLSSLPLRRLPTRCCEVAGQCARAGFWPVPLLQARSRVPVRACARCRVSACCCVGLLAGLCVRLSPLACVLSYVRACNY
jgi:hypothetical protein